MVIRVYVVLLLVVILGIIHYYYFMFSLFFQTYLAAVMAGTFLWVVKKTGKPIADALDSYSKVSTTTCTIILL
jgi:hypothetical protein